MVYLIRRLASAIALLLILFTLSSCSGGSAARRAIAEANPLSEAMYEIEIVGRNGLATLAYQSVVLQQDDKAQWDGLATVSAYNMIFQQECHSLASEDLHIKQWRGQWAISTATSPKNQLSLWLQSFQKGKGTFDETPVVANTIAVFSSNDTRNILVAKMEGAALDWSAICDAHLDSMFGSQEFLTDITTATVTLYFDADTLTLAAASFIAEEGSTRISGILSVSSLNGQTLDEFPNSNSLIEGTLSEEWDILDEIPTE